MKYQGCVSSPTNSYRTPFRPRTSYKSSPSETGQESRTIQLPGLTESRCEMGASRISVVLIPTMYQAVVDLLLVLSRFFSQHYINKAFLFPPFYRTATEAQRS